MTRTSTFGMNKGWPGAKQKKEMCHREQCHISDLPRSE